MHPICSYDGVRVTILNLFQVLPITGEPIRSHTLLKRRVARRHSALSSSMYSVSTGPEVIKLFSCSTQLSIKFILLINDKKLLAF